MVGERYVLVKRYGGKRCLGRVPGGEVDGRSRVRLKYDKTVSTVAECQTCFFCGLHQAKFLILSSFWSHKKKVEFPRIPVGLF